MKSLWILVFALPLMAKEAAETAWYDSEGNVVRVEGPDAEPAEQPFVAEWRQREIERRARTNDDDSAPFLSGTGIWTRNGVWQWRWALGNHTPNRYGCYSPRSYSGFYQPYRNALRTGSRLIIRW